MTTTTEALRGVAALLEGLSNVLDAGFRDITDRRHWRNQCASEAARLRQALSPARPGRGAPEPDLNDGAGQGFDPAAAKSPRGTDWVETFFARFPNGAPSRKSLLVFLTQYRDDMRLAKPAPGQKRPYEETFSAFEAAGLSKPAPEGGEAEDIMRDVFMWGWRGGPHHMDDFEEAWADYASGVEYRKAQAALAAGPGWREAAEQEIIALRERLVMSTEAMKGLCEGRYRCGDPDRECPLHDSHKSYGLAGDIKKNEAVLEQFGPLPQEPRP